MTKPQSFSAEYIYTDLVRREKQMCIALEALQQISMNCIFSGKKIADKALDDIFSTKSND